MTKRPHPRSTGVLAVGTVAALALSACGSEVANEPSPSPSLTQEPVTIKLTHWESTGIAEDATGPSLESQYETAYPWISIDVVVDPEEQDSLMTAFLNQIGAPSIAAISEDRLDLFLAQHFNFVNLYDLGIGLYQSDYLPWNWHQAASNDGDTLIGVGFDVGGIATCYRADLFDAAGLPSDRESVSEAIGDSWDDFIDFGERYAAATGDRFIDNPATVYDIALQQLGEGDTHFDDSGVLDMSAAESTWTLVSAIEDGGLSADLWTGSSEWDAGLANGDFAVVLCPSSMLGYIEDQVPGDFGGQWDIAQIPGPGGNWGGSFLTIPIQRLERERQAAYEFVDWLIQPEQQLKIMAETGKLPARISLLESDEVAALTNEFFNDAPYGSIFAKSVLDLPGPFHPDPWDLAIGNCTRWAFAKAYGEGSGAQGAWTWLTECAQTIAEVAAR